MPGPHRVVIIGSGFGGLFAAKALKKDPVEVTLIDRNAHHLFQPLLYQVATGILSEGEIAPATREILKRHENVTIYQGLVERIDLETRTVHWRISDEAHETPYDTLILAVGAEGSYFGHDEYSTFAPEMKTLDNALELRARIFGAFERAEVTDDPEERARLLTFAVVGAGPTGVEVAGQIRELASKTLAREYRRIDPTMVPVLLIEAGPQVLGPFGPVLGQRALKDLERLGVEVMLNTMVIGMDADSIQISHQGGAPTRLSCFTKVWAAGVAGNPLGRHVAEQAGAEVERSGKVKVTPQLELPGHPEVFIIGDLMSVPGVPGVAQGAIQSAKYVAKLVGARLKAEAPGASDGDRARLAKAERPFAYFDKGSMATIARFKAIAKVGRFNLSGFPAWVAWLGLHLLYIAGFKQQVLTLVRWFLSFISSGRAERVTTHQQLLGRLAIERLGDKATAQLIDGGTRPEPAAAATEATDAPPIATTDATSTAPTDAPPIATTDATSTAATDATSTEATAATANLQLGQA